MYRFGITMRITNALGYDEPRDSIAQDWSIYMDSAFPDSQYLFIPNIGIKAVDFIKKWKINVFILSGGDDIGALPARDNTERVLLEYARVNNIPIIGICRGMQLVHECLGGKIERGDESFIARHRANAHGVEISESSYEVNSYHSNKLIEASLHDEFKVFARCQSDNSVEGIVSDNILAMMWHPERDKTVSSWTKMIIEDFLKVL